MPISATVGRIGATVIAMARTRLALAAVEVREEAHALLGYVLWTLVAAIFGAAALLLVTLFVIVLCWDTHRLLAIGGMAVIYALIALLILARVKAGFGARGPLLAATRAELGKDMGFVDGSGVAHGE